MNQYNFDVLPSLACQRLCKTQPHLPSHQQDMCTHHVCPRASPLLSLWILTCDSEELTLGQLLIVKQTSIKGPQWLNSQSSLFTTLFKPISTWNRRWKPEVVSFRNGIYVHSLQGLAFTSTGILSYKLLPQTNRKWYLSKGILAPISWWVWLFL